MPYEAKKQVTSYTDKSVINRSHPPVVIAKEMPTGTAAFKKGTILVSSNAGALSPIAPYNPTANPQQQTVGVATSDYDPAHGSLVEVLVHGTVNKDMLLADPKQIALLVSQHPIYTI
jgi:hypothetical protein